MTINYLTQILLPARKKMEWCEHVAGLKGKKKGREEIGEEFSFQPIIPRVKHSSMTPLFLTSILEIVVLSPFKPVVFKLLS